MQHLVDILDENGFSIGVKSKEYIDSTKDNIPVVYVVVYNSFCEVFLVELSGEDDKKNLFYQKYSISSSEVLNRGEKPEDAAKKALLRNLSISATPQFLGESFFTFNKSKRLGYFFALKYDGEIEINLDVAEKGEFVAREMVDNMFLQDPDLYTPSFVEFWNKFSDKLV
ncbi:MAG: hypothetical protein HY831_01895 [Candidatus Aenigmarchaeota archaeon]|nr:hypothetical protein [Candidatus Aenigmarchaeota archaeon]